MDTHLLRLAADLLDMASERFGNDTCTDTKWPEWLTVGQRADIIRDFHKYNGDPEETEHDLDQMFGGSEYGVEDFCLMGLLAHKMREEAGPA